MAEINFRLACRQDLVRGWEETCREGEEVRIMGKRTFVAEFASDTFELGFVQPLLMRDGDVVDYFRDEETVEPVLARMVRAMCGRYCQRECLMRNTDKPEQE